MSERSAAGHAQPMGPHICSSNLFFVHGLLTIQKQNVRISKKCLFMYVDVEKVAESDEQKESLSMVARV